MGVSLYRSVNRIGLWVMVCCIGYVFVADEAVAGRGIISKLRNFKSRITKEKKQPGPTRVLYLGDSMSMGAFGRTFDAKIREAGFEVHTYVAGGATPYYWLSRYDPISSNIGFWEKTPTIDKRQKVIKEVPKVERLVEVCDPDIVVVQTGTNLYSSLRSKRRTKLDNIAEVEGLCHNMAEAATRGGRRCYWITPPSSHPDRFPLELQNEMANIMQQSISPFGRVFDSREVTVFIDPYPETDGIHYGPTEAQEWAVRVVSDFLGYAGGEAIGRRALDPYEPFGSEVVEVKRAKPVDPAIVVWGEIDIRIRLKVKTEIPQVKKVTYKSCLVLYEYEVQKVLSGYYPYDSIRVAHFGVFNRKPTAKSRYGVGIERGWKMLPLESYPSMRRLQMIDDLEPDFNMPIYVIKQG